MTDSKGAPMRVAEAAIDLPPPFRLVKLREVGEAFGHAQTIAANEGAGTLVYVGRFDVVEFATVLEPDEPLQFARRTFYAGLNALGDALSAHAPPECPITFDWPDAIRVDGGLVGGGRLAWPQIASEEDPPDWIIFGALIRTVSMGRDKGVHPLAAALEDEGFVDLGSGRLVASFARHLMSNLNAWQSIGFDVIARNYLHRLTLQKGATSSIAANGDLLVQWPGSCEPDRHSLLDALALPSWLDSNGSARRR